MNLFLKHILGLLILTNVIGIVVGVEEDNEECQIAAGVTAIIIYFYGLISAIIDIFN